MLNSAEGYSAGFNSLQTGRTFRTRQPQRIDTEEQVSIPFKREGLSEHYKEKTGLDMTEKVSIPFKREGLSEPEESMAGRKTFQAVSIPFKREGLSELKAIETTKDEKEKRFNSLQTGRTFRTKRTPMSS